MTKKFNNIYQFKITLKGIKPLIWRRIQVPETYSFWDLHMAVQDSMGWTDSHLHNFEIKNPKTRRKEEIGIPDDDFMDVIILPGWEKKIADYFSLQNHKAKYVYDYGDDWEHDMNMERILPRDPKVRYPVCIAGERACPPEDCGGSSGYEDFLEAIMDPSHDNYERMLEWIGGDFDPEEFSIADIVFDDPQERLKYALTEL